MWGHADHRITLRGLSFSVCFIYGAAPGAASSPSSRQAAAEQLLADVLRPAHNKPKTTVVQFTVQGRSDLAVSVVW